MTAKKPTAKRKTAKKADKPVEAAITAKDNIPEEKPVDRRLGGKFWMARSKHGRDKIFSTPEDLESAAYEYFEWLHENPFTDLKASHHMGEQVDLKTNKLNAPTLEGLFAFLRISKQTWHDYKSRKDFIDVMGHICNLMYSHKLAGAAAGLYNPNIIARNLGLAEKTESTVDIPQASQFDFSKMSPDARAELMKARIDGPDTD